MHLHQIQYIHQKRDELWDPEQKLTSLFHAVELAGEVGEALNIIKKIERERLGVDGSRGTYQELEDELGDVLACLCLVANAYGINLEGAHKRKFNEVSERLGIPFTI